MRGNSGIKLGEISWSAAQLPWRGTAVGLDSFGCTQIWAVLWPGAPAARQ